MDNNVKNLLDKVKNTANIVIGATGKAAQVAGKKAGELMESTKSNIEVFKLNGEIETAFKEIGQIVYATYKGEETPEGEIDKKLADIEKKYALIADIRDKSEKNQDKAEQIQETAKKCENCGSECKPNDCFCSLCGHQL